MRIRERRDSGGGRGPIPTNTRWLPLETLSGPPESPLHVPTAPAPLVHSVDAITMLPNDCAHTAFVITCRDTWLWNWLWEMPAAANVMTTFKIYCLHCLAYSSVGDVLN